MPIGIDQSYVLGLFSGASSFDLTSLAISASATSLSQVSSSVSAAQKAAPTPPWINQETPGQATANVQSALAGHNLINANSAQLDLPGASDDYKKLFALYQGLSTLTDLATRAQSSNLPAIEQTQLAKAFATGLNEVSTYAEQSDFSKLRLAVGTDSSAANTKLAIPGASSASPAPYTTPPLANDTTSEVAAFTGNVQFNISIKRINQTFNVPIDLAGMGSQLRTLPNVINYINQQLSAAGVSTRFGQVRVPGQASTITVAGKPVTLAPAPDKFALKVTPGTAEAVTFSAPQTAGAVYLGQTVGDPNPDHDPTTPDGKTQAQLLKFQTDTTNVAAPPQIVGQPNWVDGRVFATNLDPDVKTVRATQVGSDGSVYMLADVTGAVNGQSIEGQQDVALLKYDSAGHLMYTRTLGASGTATGLTLAVSADGQVAVGGSITGDLNGTTDGALNSSGNSSFADNTDSFVTLYDKSGQETWTSRRGSRLNDEVDQLTFGADGTLYVAGRAQGQMPGQGAPIGDYDGYVEALTTNAKGAPQALFTQTFGTTAADKPKGLVVDGTNLYTAAVENGHAVLRRFDISSGTPVLSASRDLGDLQGGDIAGLAMNSNGQLVVAGSTSNAALSAGTVTRASGGGTDAFAAQVDASLSGAPSDAIAYYGGTGEDRATALGVAGGKVFIAGSAGTDLPNEAPVGVKDGFLAQLDIAGGQIAWSRRFTGQAQMTAPTSIAVDATGSSILDRLGLPEGTLQTADSQELVSQSSLRPGDQFTIKSAGAGGLAQTVTIDAHETLDTLALKIQRASGFQATVKVSTALDGSKTLRIAPTYGEIMLQLGAGPPGKDALSTLGLNEGVINLTKITNGVTGPADGGSKIYGLGLSSSLNLSNPTQIAHALAQVSAAMGVIRQAYRDLSAAATPLTPLQQAQKDGKLGAAPTYMTDQLANLQAGLARLTGGISA